MHSRIFRTLDFYPLDASSTPLLFPVVTTKNGSRFCEMAPRKENYLPLRSTVVTLTAIIEIPKHIKV